MNLFTCLAVVTIHLLLQGCQEPQDSIAGSSSQSIAAADTTAQSADTWLTIPALVIGKSDVGRRNFNSAKKVLPRIFDVMEHDLNNLVPSVGEVNGDRGKESYISVLRGISNILTVRYKRNDY